jgi:ABC-type branched-subunit amino acid transport system substrate-binding protein
MYSYSKNSHAQPRRRTLKGIAGVLLLQQAPFIRAQQRLQIGQSAPLSGQNAEFGKAIVAGARAWFARFNARNLGITIDHQVLDDGNDAARAGANAQALLARGASALFGYASATLSLPALPHARQVGAPFFAPFTGASVIHSGQDPLVFTARASYMQEAEKFTEVLGGFGASRVAVVHFADRVGNENRDVVVEAIKKYQLKPGPIVAIERNQPVSEEAVKQIVAARPDAVLFTVLASPTAHIVSRAKALGLSRGTFLVTLSFVGPSQLAKLLGDEARGIVVSHVVPKPWASLEIAREHGQAIRALGAGDEPSFASLESYIAAKALSTAIERAKGTRPDVLLAAIEALNLDFGGYRLRYAKNNRHGSNFVDYTIIGQDFVR